MQQHNPIIGSIIASLSLIALAAATVYVALNGGPWEVVSFIFITGVVITWFVFGAALIFIGVSRNAWEQIMFGAIILFASVATPYLLLFGGLLQVAVRLR